MENISKLTNDSYAALIMRVAGNAAKMTLRYGGGVQRAEEVYLRMCKVCNAENPQISAFSTSISTSIELNGETYSALFRVVRRGVNLSKLNMINDLSRDFACGGVSLKEAEKKLEEIDGASTCFDNYGMLGAGFSSAFFALLLGGGVWEFILTFLIGALISYILSFFERAHSFSFMNNLFGGVVDGGMAAIMYCIMLKFGITVSVDPIVVGAMMPLLPGLAITNAIRDTISGDYVSGVANVLEALSMAIALAAGAALSLSLFIWAGVNL